MMKLVRRMILLAAMFTMGLCVAILRGLVSVDAPDSLVLVAGVVAAVISLAALAMELRWAGYHPEPEDPPGSDRVILTHDPEEDQPEPFMPPAPPAPRKEITPQEMIDRVTKAVEAVDKHKPSASRKDITPQEMIDRVTKAVEAAETYTHKANGRVKISLETDDDEPQDD